MSEQLLENVLQGIAIQGTVNNPSLVATNYYQYLANVLAPQLPKLESVDDSAMVGDGYSRVERNIYPYYFADKPWQISGELNDHISAILMHAGQGGAVVPTTRPGSVKDITSVASNSSVPKYFSLFRHLGGDNFIHGSMFVNNWSIQQEGEARPTFNSDLLGTGMFVDADALAAASFDENAMIVAPEYEHFHGARTVVSATDGVETYNWTSDGSLSSLAIESGNSGLITKRPGDPMSVTGDGRSGAYARLARIGKSTGMIKLKVDLGSSLREFKAMILRRKLTALTIKFLGFGKIGSTSDEFEYEIKSPVSQFTTIDGETDQDFGALSLEIRPLRDPVTKGRFTTRVRTNKTLI
jgi:hypothetical protein